MADIPKILHFHDGVSQLGGKKSVSVGQVQGGPEAMRDIQPHPKGYVVTRMDGRRFLIHNEMVACAELVDSEKDARPPEVPAPGLVPVTTFAKPEEVTKVMRPIEEGIVMDKHGVFSRPKAQVASEAEARSDAENAKTFRPARRRQGPTPAKE